MIALMYYSYIASEDERKEMKKIWDKNENLYQEGIKQYNLNNILKNKTIQVEPKNDNDMIEYKRETVFQKIINKIKRILRIS